VLADLRAFIEAEPQWSGSRLALALNAATTVPSAPTAHALVEPLSSRELEVLALLPTHMSTVEMARKLYVSSNTIRTHVKAIYRKLGVNSRSDAVRQAHAHRLLDATGPLVHR
jgi:LuxR family maltose regulon positive regulatory protein